MKFKKILLGITGALAFIFALTAFCGAQRTPMRFRADAMQSITDAPKRGFQVTVLAESLQCNASLPA